MPWLPSTVLVLSRTCSSGSMLLCGPPGHEALGASVSDRFTMEELHPAGDMYFCQKQETLTEAPDIVRASLIVPGYQWEMVDCTWFNFS